MTVSTSHISILPQGAPASVEEIAGGVRITVPEGKVITLVEKFQRLDPEPYTTQSRVELSIAPGARVTHYKLVLEGAHATHHSSLEVDVQKDATFYSHVFLMGGETVRNTIQV